jgi:glucans biosynthesis protein
MHGGASGSGAPLGNANALKHGLYTKEAREDQRQYQQILAMMRGMPKLGRH